MQDWAVKDPDAVTIDMRPYKQLGEHHKQPGIPRYLLQKTLTEYVVRSGNDGGKWSAARQLLLGQTAMLLAQLYVSMVVQYGC